jgi:hypothetical protein
MLNDLRCEVMRIWVSTLNCKRVCNCRIWFMEIETLWIFLLRFFSKYQFFIVQLSKDHWVLRFWSLTTFFLLGTLLNLLSCTHSLLSKITTPWISKFPNPIKKFSELKSDNQYDVSEKQTNKLWKWNFKYFVRKSPSQFLPKKAPIKVEKSHPLYKPI